jgi:hypothetical protein
MLSFLPPGQLPRNQACGTIPHAGPLPLPQRDVSKVVWFDLTTSFLSPTMSLLRLCHLTLHSFYVTPRHRSMLETGEPPLCHVPGGYLTHPQSRVRIMRHGVSRRLTSSC